MLVDSGIPNIQAIVNWTIVTTAVNSSKDVKQEESAHNILLPAVHSGRDSEVRYSTNDTSADVLPGIVEQYSTTTGMRN